MKTLKITIIALFSITLLTAVASISTTEIEPNNKKQTDVLVSLSIDKNKLQVPTNG